MYVCMFVGKVDLMFVLDMYEYPWMYVCVYVWLYTHTQECMFICIYIFMYICMITNNKEHFPVRLWSHSLRGTKVATTEGLWLLTKWNQMYYNQKPRQEPGGSCMLPYITPLPLHKPKDSDII